MRLIPLVCLGVFSLAWVNVGSLGAQVVSEEHKFSTPLGEIRVTTFGQPNAPHAIIAIHGMAPSMKDEWFGTRELPQARTSVS